MDLRTNYMGIELKNPIIASASPLTGNIDSLKKLQESGAAMVVLKSLFEEEVELSRYKLDRELEMYDDIHAEMLTLHPHIEHAGAKKHVVFAKKAKKELDIPVIASLNAVHKDTWIHYAKMLEDAGVDGLELNFYSIPSDISVKSSSIEDHHINIFSQVKNSVNIPVSVKLSPFYTGFANFTKRLDESDTDGIVLFNRVFQPTIDIESETESNHFPLTSPNDSNISVRWTSILTHKLNTPIVGNTGIHTGKDVIKLILAGAAGVEITSTLLKNGHIYIKEMILFMENWMKDKGYTNIYDFRGKLSKGKMADPWAYERSQYIDILVNEDFSL